MWLLLSDVYYTEYDIGCTRNLEEIWAAMAGHLVLLADPDGVHSVVPGSTHHVPKILVIDDLVCRHPDLSTPGDSLAALDIRRHGCPLTRPHVRAVVGSFRPLCSFHLGPHHHLQSWVVYHCHIIELERLSTSVT